jgi:hypothetical protein
MDQREADIQINGWQMTNAQSMTIRCAIEIFAATLEADGLGDNERGRAMAAAYLDRIREIRRMLRAEGMLNPSYPPNRQD